MHREYGSLRLWSPVLGVMRIVSVMLVILGVIVAMVQDVTFGQALVILLIGRPLAALFASLPLALGQGLRALADVAEYVRGQQGGVRGATRIAWRRLEEHRPSDPGNERKDDEAAERGDYP